MSVRTNRAVRESGDAVDQMDVPAGQVTYRITTAAPSDQRLPITS